MNLIDHINKTLEPLFTAWPDSLIFGITDVIKSDSTEYPGILEQGGEAKMVELDDRWAVIIYHKINSMTTTRGDKGYGDSVPVRNAYNNSMVVYFNRRRTKVDVWDMVNYIQANFPDTLTVHPYKQIIVRMSGVILNSRDVYSREYPGTDYRLPIETNFIQINYTIDATFDKGCFARCPC